ncbi:MAG: HAAS signaling domain-containing protein [Oscillospiraceae bacterium]
MNEKQLARYLRAVRRRLSLSGQMKDRVMDDLRSSINERREAGQTDAEIFAALGRQSRPRQSLPQLPGYAFRKSPLRFVCLGAAVLALLAGLLKTVTNLRGFASVGVIGGADGPTEIFIAGPQIFDWAVVIAAGIVLVLGLIGYLLLRRLPPKKG